MSCFFCFRFFKNDLCIWVSHLQVCICPTCSPYLQKAEEGIESSGTGVTDGAPPCGAWEPNWGPKQEQPMFLNTESFLRASGNFLKSRLLQTTGGILWSGLVLFERSPGLASEMWLRKQPELTVQAHSKWLAHSKSWWNCRDAQWKTTFWKEFTQARSLHMSIVRVFSLMSECPLFGNGCLCLAKFSSPAVW